MSVDRAADTTDKVIKATGHRCEGGMRTCGKLTLHGN
jgi:hypothetical protein